MLCHTLHLKCIKLSKSFSQVKNLVWLLPWVFRTFGKSVTAATGPLCAAVFMCSQPRQGSFQGQAGYWWEFHCTHHWLPVLSVSRGSSLLHSFSTSCFEAGCSGAAVGVTECARVRPELEQVQSVRELEQIPLPALWYPKKPLFIFKTQLLLTLSVFIPLPMPLYLSSYN